MDGVYPSRVRASVSTRWMRWLPGVSLTAIRSQWRPQSWRAEPMLVASRVGFTSFDWYPLTAFLWVAVGLTGFTVLQRFYAIWMRLGE